MHETGHETSVWALVLSFHAVPCHLRALADLISTGLLIVPQGGYGPALKGLHRGCGLAAGVIFRSCMSSCVPDRLCHRVGQERPQCRTCRVVPSWLLQTNVNRCSPCPCQKIIVVVVIDTPSISSCLFRSNSWHITSKCERSQVCLLFYITYLHA